ncbi:MAG: Hsp70 family protein, partial [Planctomycetota bacterium]
SKSEVFSTAADNQTEVTVHVLQGEREMARDNRTLDQFNLTGIAPAPRGMPQIEVEFAIDANGILNVTAKDKATGEAKSIEIKGSSGLSDDEIERMKRDAEEHAEEDKRKRQIVDARNQADALIHQTRTALEEHGDKVGSDVIGQIESAISDLEGKLKDESVTLEALNASRGALEKASMELGKAAYEAAAHQGAPGGPEGADPGAADAGAAPADDSPSDDDVIDAEFEVKKD